MRANPVFLPNEPYSGKSPSSSGRACRLLLIMGSWVDGGRRFHPGRSRTLTGTRQALAYQPDSFTPTRFRASQLRISQLSGSPIFWTRAWMILPPAVL